MLEELSSRGLTLEEFLAQLDRECVAEALSRTKGKQDRASELLGISVRSLRHRLDKYGMRRQHKQENINDESSASPARAVPQ